MLIDSGAAVDLGADLLPGERLVWSGRPDTRRLLVASDLYLIPFSLLWTGFAIFWEVAAVSSGGPTLLFALWGIPFVAVGLHMMFGRFVVRRWLGRRTAYAITDRRAIVVAPTWRGRRRTSFVWLGSYPPVTLRAGRHGRGTLIVGAVPSGTRPGADDTGPDSFLASVPGTTLAFWNIADAAEVSNLLTRTISDAASPRRAAAYS
jgi:hypothetical protein